MVVLNRHVAWLPIVMNGQGGGEVIMPVHRKQLPTKIESEVFQLFFLTLRQFLQLAGYRTDIRNVSQKNVFWTVN